MRDRTNVPVQAGRTLYTASPANIQAQDVRRPIPATPSTPTVKRDPRSDRRKAEVAIRAWATRCCQRAVR
jgi:hypothetical protein